MQLTCKWKRGLINKQKLVQISNSQLVTKQSQKFSYECQQKSNGEISVQVECSKNKEFKMTRALGRQKAAVSGALLSSRCGGVGRGSCQARNQHDDSTTHLSFSRPPTGGEVMSHRNKYRIMKTQPVNKKNSRLTIACLI